MAKVVILIGSPSAKSRLNGVVDRIASRLGTSDLEVSVISVRDLPAEDLLLANFGSEAIQAANKVVAEADAVVIATPVYKASFPGVLKAYIDLLPQKGLENKIVLPIAIGGTIAHLLSIDFAMKPVLSTMAPRNILAGVFVIDSQVTWNDDGTATLAEEIASRVDGAIDLLVQEVHWQTSKVQA
ncbi:NADPH-dependent FMN reductase [Cohnella thailandensis]|jgi:FMN reductase, SsuE family|uniref:NADPH-dependent FMN reductase n=1 Tax=Cohnella thailandensis TaxID=557557 RepID=A0A841SRU9_9BACL|nr:NADPH-dependent FMN reductase [Cohnella thailandensis]MBB6633669.1 NADPH-dependent FMN reductase [Cohnella thailandensis]MBP1976454.1 FMN reductase [Cohnella thailandensis]